MTRIVINGVETDVPNEYPRVGKAAGPIPGKIGKAWKKASKWISGKDQSPVGPSRFSPFIDFDFVNGVYKLDGVPGVYADLCFTNFAPAPEPGIGLRAAKALATGTTSFNKDVYLSGAVAAQLLFEEGLTFVVDGYFDNFIIGAGSAKPYGNISTGFTGGGNGKQGDFGMEPVGYNGRDFDVSARHFNSTITNVSSRGYIKDVDLGVPFTGYFSMDQFVHAYYGESPDEIALVDNNGAQPAFDNPGTPINMPFPDPSYIYPYVRISAQGHHDTANQGSVQSRVTLTRWRIYRGAKPPGWLAD